MKAGRLERQIDRAIDLNLLVLLVLSEESVRSDWVRWEAQKARQLEQRFEEQGQPRDVLCPIALDEAWESCRWPGWLRTQIEDYHVLAFLGWEDEGELVADAASPKRFHVGLRGARLCNSSRAALGASASRSCR